MGGPGLLVLLLGATLVAFGGIYEWTLPGVCAGALLLAVSARPWSEPQSPATRALDWAMLALLAAIACQLIPLPESLRTLLSPHAAALDARIRPDAVVRPSASGPLTADPSGTIAAFLIVLSALLTYRGARATFSTGGVRFVCRALAVIGALVAVEAIVQRALSPDRIYGVWVPLDPGARPFGPVVNRNHLVGWLIMASALVGGYFIAHLGTRLAGSSARLRQVLPRIARSGAPWTLAAWLVMALTIAGSQSRSGAIGFAASMLVLVRSGTTRWALAGAVVATIAIVAVTLALGGAFGTSGTVLRFAETFEATDVSRMVIWRDAVAAARDFWLTGVGAGAYSTAMAGLQTTHAFADHLGRAWHFNQAHSHYLQIAAEGGVLVGLPVVIAVVLFVRLAARRIRAEQGEMIAVRLGAIAGLIGIAVQSLWEVPLTMPAAALLAATLAAVATYERRPRAAR